MNREAFERQNVRVWDEFETQVSLLENGSRDPSLRSFPEVYRQICRHLAMTRARNYGPDLEHKLNRLALRAHQVLYRGERLRARDLLDRFLGRFPRALRRHWRLFWIATALLYVPQFLMHWLVTREPQLIYSFMDAESVFKFELMYQDSSATGTRGSESDFEMFGFYIFNNISIAFRTFAGGLIFGLGSIFYLVYNGLHFGAVEGHLQNSGLLHNLYPFVVGHSAFEVTAITICGAAGLKLGGALVFAGRRSRLNSLQTTALEVLPLVGGAAAFLVAAAFIEAFWSSTPTEPWVRYSVGAAMWAAVAAFLLFAGRQGQTRA